MTGQPPATVDQLAELIAAQIDYDRLADAIAERVGRPVTGEWLTAKECARRFGHTARWWRQHKAEFGAVPDGEGPRPRLMFNTAAIERMRGL